MLFNSVEFAVFFIAVWGLYRLLPHRAQNSLLLGASYFFYGWWDWRFLSLLIISTLVDYTCGRTIAASPRPATQRLAVAVSIGTNLSILGFFKYFDFFADSLRVACLALGWQVDLATLHIVLPVGISFYTFQTMSYTLDVYRKQIKPAHDFIDFALFVAFFPQLVAGPIQRTQQLLPQIAQPRKVGQQDIVTGFHLLLWGLCQKVFIADHLASLLVDPVFAAPHAAGAEVLLAAYGFAVQIYCDFAGYSNMARGIGRMLGFDIMVNFNLPYLAVTPSEFWQRWHISLSTWLRDYLYIPLGGNRRGAWFTLRNLMITMILGGLWHGAAWTFVFWGLFHGLLLVDYRLGEILFQGWQAHRHGVLKRLKIVFGWVIFFHGVCFGWILFRAQSMHHALDLLQAICFNFGNFWAACQARLSPTVGMCFLTLLIMDGAHYLRKDPRHLARLPAVVLAGMHGVLIYLIFRSPVLGEPFIYFQF